MKTYEPLSSISSLITAGPLLPSVKGEMFSIYVELSFCIGHTESVIILYPFHKGTDKLQDNYKKNLFK